jgi:hypothetical protein
VPEWGLKIVDVLELLMNLMPHKKATTFVTLALIAGVLLAGCDSSASPTATALPTDIPTLTGVEIESPQSGTVIYAEMVYISGAVTGESRVFRLEMVDTEDNVLAQTTLDEEPGDWTAELVHGYAGEPTEITIRAVPDDGDETAFDTVSVLLADSSQRPAGSFGSILQPGDGVTLGGDSIPVEGMASGLFENEFILELIDEGGTTIDQEFVLLNNPYFIDEVPWQAVLSVSGYTGPAQIRAYYIDAEDGSEQTLDSITIEISDAAG